MGGGGFENVAGRRYLGFTNLEKRGFLAINPDEFEDIPLAEPAPKRGREAPPPLPVADGPRPIGYANWTTGRLRGAGRDGKLVVAPDGCDLGSRCVLCNEESDRPRKMRTMTWFPRWVLVTVLAGLLIAAIIIAIIQKKTKIAFGLCEAHRKRRLKLILLTWLLSLSCPAAMIFGLILADTNKRQGDGGVYAIGGVIAFFVLFIGAVIVGMRARALTCTFIKDGVGVFKGAGEAFLDTLPGVVAPR